MVAPLRLRSKGGRQHRLHPLPEMLVAALEWLLVACESRLFLRFWAEARARFGGEGDYLFGDWSAADMMFAPVVTRFITYSIPLPRFALPYCQAVVSHPHMQEWIGGAQAEDWVIEQFEGAQQD